MISGFLGICAIVYRQEHQCEVFFFDLQFSRGFVYMEYGMTGVSLLRSLDFFQRYLFCIDAIHTPKSSIFPSRIFRYLLNDYRKT